MLSIIIPVLNEAVGIESCLEALVLLEGDYEVAETISACAWSIKRRWLISV